MCKVRNSFITQYVSIYEHTDQIDFKTIIESKDSELFYKASFETGIMAKVAYYDLSLGYLTRDALSESAEHYSKFEVATHKWFAIKKNDGNGFAILNDSKYN